jgi:hypothetical protein
MSVNLKKSFRALRRDYFDATGMGSTFAAAMGLVGIVGTCMAAALGGIVPAAIVLLGTCAVSGGVIGLSALAGKSYARKQEDAWIEDDKGNRTHIVGPGLKVTTLVNTQDKVHQLTRHLSRSAAIPAEDLKKLEPWLRDAADAAQEVQGWDQHGNTVTSITYLRDIFNAQGTKVKTPAATVDLYDPNVATTPAPVAGTAAPAIAAPTPSVIVVPKTITLKNQATP